jgi:predicted transcriptional regulator
VINDKKYIELPDEIVDKLEEILLYLEDGRVYLAREQLEQLLGIEHKDHA